MPAWRVGAYAGKVHFGVMQGLPYHAWRKGTKQCRYACLQSNRTDFYIIGFV
jgi:hypothetical protein